MKKLFLLAAVLVALLIVAFFVVTSSGFLKGFVLPRVASALNAKVEAESIALSPFSSVEIRKLVVTPNGAETLASVELARVRFSLFTLLGGKIALEEVLVQSPTVTLVQKADGTSNLDPILKQVSANASQAKPAPAGGGKPPQVDLKSIKVENASLNYRSTAKDGAEMNAAISSLNFTAADLRNGASGKLEFNAGLKVDQKTVVPTPAASALQGTSKGTFTVALTPDLQPASLAGQADLQVASATGAYKDVAGLTTALSTDLSPTELKRLTLEFLKDRVALGSVSAKGPLDLAKKEGQLQVDIASIDKNVLNLVGGPMGLDFTTTRLDSSNRLELTQGGSRVAVIGSATGSKISIKRADLVTPALDARDSYDLTVDLKAQSAEVKAFALSVNQGGREVVNGRLSAPLLVAWGNPNATAPDANLEFDLKDLRLADWSALIGTPLQGSLTARAKLGVSGAGKDLGFDVNGTMAGLTGKFGSNEVRNLGAALASSGKLASFADPAKRRLNVQAKVTDLAGQAAVLDFSRYGVEAQADVGLPENAITLNDVQVKLSDGGRPGGAMGLKGQWNTQRGAGDLQISAREVNETGLRPFLQAALGEKQLRTVLLSAELGAKIDPAAESTVKGAVILTNLVVRDPSGTVPETPLAAGLAVDAGGTGQKLVIRQGELRLAETARAKNVLGLTGELDFSKTNALKGNLKLAADSVDITAYLDLFAGKADTNAPPAATPPPSTGPQREPDPIRLPIELLTMEARIGKFFVREIAAENFLAVLKLTSSRVELQPFQLAFNGAPLNAKMNLNLGVPGYEYDLNFSADHLPVRPIANSFSPMLKNRIEGAVTAGATIKGAGITGTSLQKSLTGGLNLSVTNANLKLADETQKKGFLSVLTGLLATALNIRELKEQPIMDLIASAQMGGGKIDLTNAVVRSSSFEAGSVGSIPIAANLMQSPLSFPLNLALRRDLADRAKLVSSDTPTNAAYVAIPAIASIKGTLGAPAPEVDKVKAGLLAARAIGGALGGKAGDAVSGVADLVGGVAKGGTNAVGNLIQGIGGLLGRGKSSTPGESKAAPTTPAPAPAPTPTPATPAAPPKTSSTLAPSPSTNVVKPLAPATVAPRAATNTVTKPAATATNAPAAAPATNTVAKPTAPPKK